MKRFVLTIACLAMTVAIAGQAQAGLMVGGGNNDNEAGFFTITTTSAPFLVTNPTGLLEYRAAVEFDLRALPASVTFSDTLFIVRGVIETQKTLRTYPKRGLTLWRRVDVQCVSVLAGEGQTPFRIGSKFASLSTVAVLTLALCGCERKETIVDIETPGGQIEVERSVDTGAVDVQVTDKN